MRVEASLPARSWIAFASFDPEGSVYESKTVCDAYIVDERLIVTVVPEAVTEDTEIALPLAVIVNVLVAAVVEDKVSL